MPKENDYYHEFLAKDFERQYQEYRQAENSRIHYVQFLISLVIAVLAFFAALYQAVGFPFPNIYPMWILLFISMVLFFIGYGVTNICISTRVSQMQTAKYLNDITQYFFKLAKNETLKTSRKRIYFADKDWASEKTPFFRLMKIIAFLLGVLSALLLFSLSRIIFWYLELSRILPVFDFSGWFGFWDYLTWSNVISVIVGIMAWIISYQLIKRKIRKDLLKEQKQADKETA